MVNSEMCVTVFSYLKNVTNPRCVYWNFTAAGIYLCNNNSAHNGYDQICLGGNGNWSTDGCNTSVNINDSLSSITCHCDHLTNFACLVVSCIL